MKNAESGHMRPFTGIYYDPSTGEAGTVHGLAVSPQMAIRDIISRMAGTAIRPRTVPMSVVLVCVLRGHLDIAI